MSTIYIVISPVTDFCADYALLCKDNKTYLSQQGLLYDLEQNFRERFACHGYLTLLLHRTGDAGSSVSDIVTALKEFDSLAEKTHKDILLFIPSPTRQGHLKLLEPLRGLFKDEVRELGVALGLPAEMVYRHPFPGPGLGVRILGEVKKEYADLLREADAIFIEELRNAGLYDKVSQAFVVFLPVKSVGVMGDGRTYEWVVSLRSVETSDFMTARWSHLPYELLGKVSNRIINEVRGINRVCYDISGKPPATIEWE